MGSRIAHVTGRTTLAAAALLVLFVAPALRGQGVPGQSPVPPRLDAAMRRAVVDTIASQMLRFYMDADTGRIIAEHVRRRLDAGAYDGIADPRELADRLTLDLRAVNDDKHIRVAFAPNLPGERPGAEGVRLGTGPGLTPAMLAEFRARHFGLGRVELLPGNIGYWRLDGFDGGQEAEAAALAGLRYLEFADAIIFDLRRNGGGSPEQVNFILSHFVPGGVASLAIHDRSSGQTVTRKTLATVPGPRRLDVPLYALTSRYTISGGEDFPFSLQNLRRATIVGAVTAGASHMIAALDSGHGFRTFVPFTRVSDPRTGREWERVGVQPDVRVDPDSALEVAEALALDRLAASAQGAPRRTFELARAVLEASWHPHPVPPATLASYAGRYGAAGVALEDGRLLFRPLPDAPPDTLIPLRDDHFGVRAGTREIDFVHDARGGLVLQLVAPDGTMRAFPRSDREGAPGS